MLKDYIFHLIEIYNNSVPNDPSPPSKAVAVLHRKPADETNKLPIATNVFLKTLDYNNRDFYKWQMHRVVDDIASQWLCESGTGGGGGVMLHVHRNPSTFDLIRDDSILSRINRFMNKNRNRVNMEEVEIYSKSTEIEGEKNWKNYFEIRFFLDLKSFKTKKISSDDEGILKLVHIDHVRRIVYTRPIDASSSRDMLNSAIQKILRETKCVEGVVVYDTFPNDVNCYHSFVMNQKLVGSISNPLDHLTPLPIDYKYLVAS